MAFNESEVKAQYENYPYPKRDPEHEKVRLINTPSNQLDRINHYCFSGNSTFDKDFRVLVAGGGTGDAAIMLAEQLRNTPAEIVYLDMSRSSMQVARERARIRGLQNIKWIESSLLKLPEMDIGGFDYINCSGVLHHLDSPDAGLHALTSVLKHHGALSVMVYAPYGRTGVYLIQELMRHINHDISNLQHKVDNTRTVLNTLQKTNIHGLAAKNRFRIDIEEFGDIGIYDLFLHSQDRAYTVSQLYEFIESQDLKIIQFFGDLHRNQDGLVLGNQAYNPAAFLKDSSIGETVRKLPLRSQQAIAELLHGGYHMHSIYASRQIPLKPDPGNLDHVPNFTIQWNKSVNIEYERLAQHSNNQVVMNERGPGGKINCTITFAKTPNAPRILGLINGVRTLREIYDTIQSETTQAVSVEQLSSEFDNIFTSLHMHNRMFLRHQSVPGYQTLEEMQSRVSSSGNGIPNSTV